MSSSFKESTKHLVDLFKGIKASTAATEFFSKLPKLADLVTKASQYKQPTPI